MASLEQMVEKIEDKLDKYEEEKDADLHKHDMVVEKDEVRE